MTLELSTTSFAKASLCPKKYEYHAVHKLATPYERFPLNMRRGIWMHAALQKYYTEPGRPDTWRAELIRLGNWVRERGVPEETIVTVYDECVTIMERYIEYYSSHDDRLAGGKVLLSEEPVYLKVPRFDAVLRTTIDLVIETKQGIWVVEHKTTGEFPPVNWMSVDPQTAIDLIVLTQGKRKIAPDGIVFNYILTKAPSVPRPLVNGSAFRADTAVTTSSAFEEGADALRHLASQNPKLESEVIERYIEDKRRDLVADGKWFRQSTVFRPTGVLVQTAKDVMGILAHIRMWEAEGHYPRAFHVHNCPKFCEYSDLCIGEYVNGRPSKEMREADYRYDDGTREGR